MQAVDTWCLAQPLNHTDVSFGQTEQYIVLDQERFLIDDGASVEEYKWFLSPWNPPSCSIADSVEIEAVLCEGISYGRALSSACSLVWSSHSEVIGDVIVRPDQQWPVMRCSLGR